MPTIRSFLATLQTAVIAVTLWAACCSAAFARAAAKPPPPEKSYVLSYFLVVMVIGLGLMLVLRPTGRATEVKPPTEK